MSLWELKAEEVGADELLGPTAFGKRAAGAIGRPKPFAHSYITQKLVNTGKIPVVAVNGKNMIPFNRALEALKNIQDPGRDSQRNANLFDHKQPVDNSRIGKQKRIEEQERMKKLMIGVDDLPEAKASNQAIIPDADSDDVYNDNNREELRLLLAAAKTPGQKVQITKDFWAGKINRQKYLKDEGDLIWVTEAKAAFEEMLSPLNRALDDLPINFKAHFNDTPQEAVEWLYGHINELKSSLRNQTWD